MCGRYVIEFEEDDVEFKAIIDEINRKYNNTEALAQMKTGEIFPTNIVPVLASEHKQPFLMNWGFPRGDGKGVIINARAETATEKKMFRSSVLSRRCVIPSSGFFEWSHSNSKKAPTLFDYTDAQKPMPKGKYLLRIPKSPMLYMAGFYNEDIQDRSIPSFVILTTEANEWVSPLHDRMPVILKDSELSQWISDDRYAADLLSRPCTTTLSSELVQ